MERGDQLLAAGRLAVGVRRMNDPFAHQRRERFGERHHAGAAAILDRRGQLERFSFDDQAGHGRRVQQHLAGGNAPAAQLTQQDLRDDPAEAAGERGLRLLATLDGKQLDQPFDG